MSAIDDWNEGWTEGYEQAVHDCIAEVAELTEKGDSVRPGDVMYVLNALLEKP